ncbi:ATP-binding protein [Leisingera sp. M527]|nr:ATP-binding protein [Leisingera sp. M527]
MEHFKIIQALCRSALGQENPAIRKQVERLRDALREEGMSKEASQLSRILTNAERTVEMKPSRITKSKSAAPGETLTPATKPPVDRETGAVLASITFPTDTTDAPPILPEAIQGAINSLLEEWRHIDALSDIGIAPPKTCLIYGAPGTGKTRLAHWLANQLGLPVLLARIDGLVSSFLGTTARNIGNLFAFANRYQCVLLLDEFDAIAKLRDDPQEVGEIKRVVNSLLQNLDERNDVGITMGITNHPRLLDPAVWRRFEVQLEMPSPDFEVRIEIARSFMAPVDAPESHVKLLAWFTEGATGAEIETLVRTYKKSFAINKDNDRRLLETLQHFATLNSARINSERRELLFQRGNLFKALHSDEQLNMSFEDIGQVAGVNKSTISRSIHRSNISNKG